MNETFIPELRTGYDPLISYKKVIAELTEEYAISNDALGRQYGEEWLTTRNNTKNLEIEKFKVDSSRVVNYLVKEFEMRKSATSYKRATVAKTGELNVRKLHAYRHLGC